MKAAEILDYLKKNQADRVKETHLGEEGTGKDAFVFRDATAVVAAEHLVAICRVARDCPDLEFDLLSCISGVDYPERGVVEVVYHLDSTKHHHLLALKVAAPRDDPHVPSVTGVWSAANWLERETFDLLGVVFDGHPNLKRILCAEDWEGYPLRKDYVMPRVYHGVANAFEQFYRENAPEEGLVAGGGDTFQ